AARRAIFRQQGQQQTPAPGTEIEETVGSATVRQLRDDCLDDRLGFGARVERVRRQRKVEAPELAPAEDAAQRLVRQRALPPSDPPLALVPFDHAVEPGQE